MASSAFLECFGLSPSSTSTLTRALTHSRRRQRCGSDDGMYENDAAGRPVGNDEVGIPFSVVLKRQSDAALHEMAASARLELASLPNVTNFISPAAFQSANSESSSSSSDELRQPVARRVNTDHIDDENRLRALGILSNKPCRSEYVTYEARLGSFMGSSWPEEHRLQKPTELAEAGLYYSGRGDCVKCFFCGGRLRYWQPEDNVWREHARWYPHCAFVHNVKGRHFIEQAGKPDDLHATPALPVSSSPSSSSAVASTSSGSSSASSGDEISSTRRRRHSEQVLRQKKFNLSNTSSSSSGSGKKPSTRSILTPACRICLDRDVCIAFLPCGHLAACAQCAPALKDCPICRAKILSTVRTYMV